MHDTDVSEGMLGLLASGSPINQGNHELQFTVPD
jgi:hypothetical protein